MVAFHDFSEHILFCIFSFAAVSHDVVAVVHRLEVDSYQGQEDPASYVGGWRTILVRLSGMNPVWCRDEYLDVLGLPPARLQLKRDVKRNWNLFMKSVALLCRCVPFHEFRFNGMPRKHGGVNFANASRSCFTVEYYTRTSVQQIAITDMSVEGRCTENLPRGFQKLIAQFIQGNKVNEQGQQYCHVVIANNPDSVLCWRSVSISSAMKLSCKFCFHVAQVHESCDDVHVLRVVPPHSIPPF